MQKVIVSIQTVSTTQKAREINDFPSFLLHKGMSMGFGLDARYFYYKRTFVELDLSYHQRRLYWLYL